MGWDKDNLTGKAKAVPTSKAKQGINSLLPWADRCSAIPGEQAPIKCNGDLGRQKTVQILPLSPFTPTVYTVHDVTWSGISLWSVRVTCPTCVPSKRPVHPQSSLMWWYEKQKRLCASPAQQYQKHLCYQLCVQHKSKTQPHTSHGEENYLYPSQNQHTHEFSGESLFRFSEVKILPLVFTLKIETGLARNQWTEYTAEYFFIQSLMHIFLYFIMNFI